MAYLLTGNDDAPVLPGMIIRCHTNRCTRVMVLKKYTEGIRITSYNVCYTKLLRLKVQFPNCNDEEITSIISLCMYLYSAKKTEHADP